MGTRRSARAEERNLSSIITTTSGANISKRARIYGTSGLLLLAMLVYALNLRAPFISLAPIVTTVADGLGVTPETVGILTGIPVLCFALVAPFASMLIGRVGIERAITLSLFAVFVGTCVRSAGGFEMAVVGTVIIGAAITIGNVAVPVLIARDFSQSAGAVTGLYTGALNLGSVVTTLVTAPLAASFGWRWALVAWGLVMIVAAVLWQRATAGREKVPVVLVPAHGTSDAELGPVWRRGIAWCLTLTFVGQAFSYYAVTTWLPKILTDTQGMSDSGAGGAASIFQFFGIVGGVGVPLLMSRRMPLRAVFACMSVLWLSLPVGLLVAPELWPLWAALAGMSQGGNFTVIFTLVVQRSRSQSEARRMSAMIQGLGYSAAAAGPYAIGALHTATDGWTVPLFVVLGALTIMTVSGLLATGARRETA
jgi:CP family cyanate transporter-like MFS transporter